MLGQVDSIAGELLAPSWAHFYFLQHHWSRPILAQIWSRLLVLDQPFSGVSIVGGYPPLRGTHPSQYQIISTPPHLRLILGPWFHDFFAVPSQPPPQPRSRCYSRRS